MQLIQIFR